MKKIIEILNFMKPLKLFNIFFFAVLCSCKNPTKQVTEKENIDQPNIIYIYTDQLSETMMSCAGNKYVKTPAMDYIANNGIRFTRAYTTNPVCSPARVSLMTGRFPGYFKDSIGQQVRENAGSMMIPEVSKLVESTTIAAYLKDAGYDLAFGGKEHLPPSLSPKALGFINIASDERDVLAEKAAKYISQDHTKPYFMTVSLINPHDICFMAIRDFAESEQAKGILKHGKTEITTLDEALKLPPGVGKDEFFAEHCPPLPPNFEPQKNEPKAISALLEARSFRISARKKYTKEQWRMHRWAYARLTEKVDGQIQVILDALKKSGQEENTVVIFSSDHGDNDASHKMEHKTVLYEESANIPFMAMWKGKIPTGQVNTKNLVSNGLDLLPTVCDYAGIKGQSDPRGISLKPLFEGNKTASRKTLGVESEIGRMVVSEDGFKYVRYDAMGTEERLMDLNTDPYEKTHVTNEQSYSEVLSRLRKSFDEEWFPNLQRSAYKR
ncbi:MAG: sulfatase family protein [Flavobacteriales bacterium]|jgi:choline-sulfatase|tara:strand:- start:341 stop:1828 length:1488 start_codon:yes stop_codon:yes gene_type:complete